MKKPIPLIYLASPFSNPDPRVEAERYHQTCQVMAILLDAQHLVFSPITHARPICEFRNLLPRVQGSGFNTWEKLDLEMIYRCDELWVACLDGWEDSYGVREEIRFAHLHKKPIRYVTSIEPLMIEDQPR